MRHSILASGGLYKFKIIRAILRAGYVKQLVTDQASAEALLRDAPPDRSKRQ